MSYSRGYSTESLPLLATGNNQGTQPPPYNNPPNNWGSSVVQPVYLEGIFSISTLYQTNPRRRIKLE